jgi:molecular chaperone DnaJ
MCQECGGTGAAAGSKPETCRECAGSGQLRFQQGFFTISRTCSVCSGTGHIVRTPCSACSGQGARSVESKLMVKIPAGIDHGQRLKLRGEGEAGAAGGPSGDLYVQIAVKKHEIFERQESEIVCEVPVTFATAALGAEIEVPTLEGPHKLKIPAGTQSGKVFRLKGKGIPVLGSDRRGDEHIRIAVEVPKKLSPEMRAALEKLRELEKTEADSASKSFINKVKGMFG